VRALPSLSAVKHLCLNGAADEAALPIEVVVDQRMNRDEFLQRLHTWNPLHRPIQALKRLMRVVSMAR